MDNKKTFLIFQILIIIAFPIFFGSFLFITPFFGDFNLIDEGQFAAWANHMLHGKLMYKDIYITYGPLFVHPLYLLFKFFGPSAFITRLYFVTLSSILGMLIVFFLVNKIKLSKISRIIFLAGLILFPGMNIRMGMAYLVILFVVNSMRIKQYYWDLLIGVSCVLAFLISPETGIFCFTLSFLYYFYLLIASSKIAEIFKKISLYFLGVVLICSLFALWAGSEGWLYSYVKTTFNVLISFSGMNLPNGQMFPNMQTMIPQNLNIAEWIRFIISRNMILYWQAFFYICVLLYILVRFVLRNISKSDLVIFLICLYGLFAYVSIIGKHGGFYFTFIPIIIFSIYFGEKSLIIYKLSKNHYEKITSLLVFIILVGFAVRLTLFFRPHFNKIFQASFAISSYDSGIERLGLIKVSDSQGKYIIDYQTFINKKTDKNDYIFILTNEAAMYMFVNRLNSTRYDLPYVAATIEKRHEMLNDLKLRKPVFIFEDSATWEIDGISNRKRLPEVYEYITQNYGISAKLGSIIVYKDKTK